LESNKVSEREKKIGTLVTNLFIRERKRRLGAFGSAKLPVVHFSTSPNELISSHNNICGHLLSITLYYNI
jgi:hypothetical protein